MKKIVISLGVICFIIISYLFVGYTVKMYYDEILSINEKEIEDLKTYNQSLKVNIAKTINLNEKILRKLDSCNNKKSNYQFGFEMNGKSISTLELLEYVNETANENIKLKNDIKNYKSLLESKENLINQFSNKLGMKKNEDESYTIDEKGFLKNIITERDKYKREATSNKYLLNMIMEKYGINATYNIEGDIINYTLRNSPTLDSALMIYPHYKHKLFKNKKGKWIVK